MANVVALVCNYYRVSMHALTVSRLEWTHDLRFWKYMHVFQRLLFPMLVEIQYASLGLHVPQRISRIHWFSLLQKFSVLILSLD